MSRPLVENAADPRQTGRAERKLRERRREQAADWAAVLDTAAGRRLFWTLLEHCGVYESVFSSDAGRMAFLAGKQDVGHYLMAQADRAVPGVMLTIMAERQAAREREAAETVAFHTASVEDGKEHGA